MRVQIKKILCASDFSDLSKEAVSFGISLAEEFKARLLLCHVIDLTSATMYGEAFIDISRQLDPLQQYAERELRGMIGDRNIEWEPLTRIGHAVDEIKRVTEEQGVDLVLCATHGRSGLKKLLLGSVTERLIRTLPCPLLVIRNMEQDVQGDASGEAGFQRILVGCDFSEDSGLALQFGLSMAQEFQSELHLVHVIEPAIYKDMLKPAGDARENIKHVLSDLLKNKLEKLIPEEAFHWCSPKTNLLAGQPHKELTKYAVVNDMDLIVLGVRGHGVVEKFIVGSTTDRVALQAPCSVLTASTKVT